MKETTGRYISLGTFLLVVLCFLLPFARGTCGGHEVATLSGYELAFGATKSMDASGGMSDLFGGGSKQSRTEKVPMVISAILCLLAALAGAGLGLMPGRNGIMARLVAGGLGFILLFIIMAEAKGKLLGRAGDATEAIALESGGGWVLALFAFLGAIAINILGLVLKPRRPSYAATGAGYGPSPGYGELQPPPSTPPGQAAGTKKFCGQCGKEMSANDTFCPGCGGRSE